MIKMFTSISLSEYRKLIFVSLSFHEDYPLDSIELKKFLDNYLKRILRSFPTISYIWRFEYQKRGAPHFHFIFLIPNQSTEVTIGKFIKSIRNHYLEVKGCHCFHCCKFGFDFDELENHSKAFSYISKYCAKVDEQDKHKYNGRKWGNSRNIIRNQVNVVTLRGYQYQYFKYLLFNHYKKENGKAEYIDKNIKSLYSWFLICPFDVSRSIIKKTLTTNLKDVYETLKANKIFYEDYLLDTDNCLISLYVDELNGTHDNTVNYASN
jgi:hypothetical protein